MSALRRLLVLLGLVHVVDAVVWSLLWRHRRSWARALWAAVLDELTARPTGKDRPGRSQHRRAGRPARTSA